MKKLKEKMTKNLEQELNNVVDSFGYSHVLKQAVAYTLLNYGKLFRPCLTLMLLQDLIGDYRKGLRYATAIELVHVYGLLHDDLPALDDARYRRKKLVNHLVYGEAQAILAGDALQAEAFKYIAKTDVQPKIAVQLIELMSNMIGANGYVGGQSLDILNENEDVQYIDDEMIQKVHFGKTGALFEAAVLGAGMIADLKSDKMKVLAKLAEEIGLAFQIRDDIIDVTKTEKEAGKDTRSDLKKDKMTYPKLHGLTGAEELFYLHYNTALELIKALLGSESKTYSYIKEFLKLA